MTLINRGCILFVSPGPDVADPSAGHGTRIKHLSQGLAESWKILALVPDTLADKPIDWADKQYSYDRSNTPFLTDFNPSFLLTLSRIFNGHNIDIVDLRHGICAAKALAVIHRTDATVVYSAQGFEAGSTQDYIPDSLPVHKRVLAPRLVPLIERLTVSCAGCITTVSEKDRCRFVDHYNVDESRVTAIPTGTTRVDFDTLPPQEDMRDRFGLTAEQVAVFHGTYEHWPNEDAVVLIEDYLAPTIRKQGMDIEFLLIGKGMPDSDDPNVTSVGFVEDLFPALHAADFAVVPIRHGAGTKTKVYDYLSLGLPMVTTAKGIEGIDLERGTHCLVTGDISEQFVDSVIQLASNDEDRVAMQRAQREFAREHSWARSINRLDKFYTNQV